MQPPSSSGPPAGWTPPPAQPDWTPPSAPRPPRRRGVLIVVLITVPLLLLTAVVGVGTFLYQRLHEPPGLPSDWVTAGFTVDATSAGLDTVTRERVGQLLAARIGGHARYVVRPRGVRVGVPSAERSRLSRLGSQLPLRTDVSLRPVLAVVGPGAPQGTTPAPSPVMSTAAPSPSGGAGRLPSLDGATYYTLGPAAVTGAQVRSASYHRAAGDSGQLVDVSLTAVGGRQLAALTGRQVGQQLAIVTAGVVVSAPMVQAPITGGELQIAGLSATQAGGIAACFLLGRHPVRVRTGDPG